MSNEAVPIYRLDKVSRTYGEGDSELTIFTDLNLEVQKGETLAILGASGSGKSTLLHLMGALDQPSSGSIYFNGDALSAMTQTEQANFRNRSLGFVFQFHHLLPEFTALENVAVPGLIAGLKPSVALEMAKSLIERVGLAHRQSSKPSTLSGGERQRAAIARALLLGPQAILADEPTGNLDEHTGAIVGDLMLELNRELGTTLIVVTHNRELAARMDRSLELRAGALYEKVLD